MIYFLEFVSEALEEAEEATRYYQEIQLGLGLRFREEVEAITQAINGSTSALEGTQRRISTSQPARISVLHFLFFAGQ